MFAVPKSGTHDRLILNPTLVNSRCRKYSNFTKLLTPGSLACCLHLEEGEVLRMCADDLSEMYYTFQVPLSVQCVIAAGWCLIPMSFPIYNALNALALPCIMCHVLIALSALAMGDGLAVEIAISPFCICLPTLSGLLSLPATEGPSRGLHAWSSLQSMTTSRRNKPAGSLC